MSEFEQEFIKPSTHSKTMIRGIVRAFCRAAEGRSVDNLLCSPQRTAAFLRECANLNIHASENVLLRLLMAIRKNPKKFEAVIPRSTVRDPITTGQREAALPGVEVALSTLVYRHRSSIDDVLVSPVIRSEFDSLCQKFVRDADIEVCRRTALYLRKVRMNAAQHDADERADLQFERLRRNLREAGTVGALNFDLAKEAEGLFTLQAPRDSQPYIFCGVATRLDVALQAAVREDFWANATGGLMPIDDVADIRVRIFNRKSLDDHPVVTWARRLIEVKQPYFNLPLAAA
ncbi:MAG: hypothetical protein AAGE65_03545 [Planctomycetota bacterium]